MATLGEATEQVLAICELRKRRDATSEWYRSHFATLKRELGEKTKLIAIDRARLQKFVDGRVRERIARGPCGMSFRPFGAASVS